MIQETVWMEPPISVPTQEWLSKHSEWYEEPEENPVIAVPKSTLIIGAATVVLIIVTILQYGGF